MAVGSTKHNADNMCGQAVVRVKSSVAVRSQAYSPNISPLSYINSNHSQAWIHKARLGARVGWGGGSRRQGRDAEGIEI